MCNCDITTYISNHEKCVNKIVYTILWGGGGRVGGEKILKEEQIKNTNLMKRYNVINKQTYKQISIYNLDTDLLTP